MSGEKLFIGDRPTIALTEDGEHVSLAAPGVREIVLPIALFRLGFSMAREVIAEHDRLQARRGLRAETAVVPLCDLCTRHSLPKEGSGRH